MSDVDRMAGELVTATDAGAIELVAAHAAERLAGICEGWPADRFRRLVLEVARVRLRFGIPRAEYEMLRLEYERRSAATHHDVVHSSFASGDPAVAALPAPAPAPSVAASLAGPADAPPLADVTPPVQLPRSMQGYRAALDRPANAPT